MLAIVPTPVDGTGNPVVSILILARLARDGRRARLHVVAHAVAETDGIGNDDLARNRRRC